MSGYVCLVAEGADAPERIDGVVRPWTGDFTVSVGLGDGPPMFLSVTADGEVRLWTEAEPALWQGRLPRAVRSRAGAKARLKRRFATMYLSPDNEETRQIIFDAGAIVTVVAVGGHPFAVFVEVEFTGFGDPVPVFFWVPLAYLEPAT